jgi:hypothetical protein
MTDKLEVGQLRIWTAYGTCWPLVITAIAGSAVKFEDPTTGSCGYLCDLDMLDNSRVATKLDRLLMGMTD